MLKIIKHDAKLIFRTNFSLMISMLCLAVVTFLFNLLLSGISSTNESTVFIRVSLISVISLSSIAIVVLFAMCVINVYTRYMHSIFGDEGYLTMVLPVRTSRLLLAKIFSGAIWLSISGAVMVVSAVIAWVLPAYILAGPDLWTWIPPKVTVSAENILSLANSIVMLIGTEMAVFAGINIGAVFVPKHRSLGSFLFAAGVIMVQSVLTTLISSLTLSCSPEVADMIYLATSTLLTVGFIVAEYFLSVDFLTKRFNIE